MKKLNLFAAALVGAAACMTSCSGSDSWQSKVEYIAVQENEDGNWSLLDPEGKVIFADEFKNMPSCVIEGAFSVRENDGYTVYSVGKKPEVIGDLEGLYAVGHYEDGLLPITRKKNRVTVVDKSGKEKFVLEPIKGKEITGCSEAFYDGMLYIYNEEGLGGYVNTSGKVVIEPKYNDVNPFSDGLALVRKDAKDDEQEYLVINKKGETQFKLRKGSSPMSYAFYKGWLATRDVNDHISLYDKKGEITKLPSKVSRISEIDGEYITFANEDGEWGVIKLDGEVVIRAKYEAITIMEGGNFLCNKEDKAVVLDKNGDEKISINDYQSVAYVGKFGLWGHEKNSWVMLDKEGKPVKNAEFYNIAKSTSADGGMVRSDYFNTEAVVNEVVSMLSDTGIEKYKFGATASTMFSNPENYSHDRYVTPDELKREGYRYKINVRLGFTGYIADWSYGSGYWDFSRHYYFTSATLSVIGIKIDTGTEWGNDGSLAIVKALKAKGATQIASTPDNNDYYACALKYGKLIVDIESRKDASVGSVSYAPYTESLSASIKETISRIETSSNKNLNDYATEVVEEVVEADTVASAY